MPIAVSLLLCGCARTFNEAKLADFNSSYQQNLPMAPKFEVSSINSNLFSITVHQGEPLMFTSGEMRASILRRVALTVASDFCGRAEKYLGQVKLDQLGSDGWVHISGYFSCDSGGASKIPPSKQGQS